MSYWNFPNITKTFKSIFHIILYSTVGLIKTSKKYYQKKLYSNRDSNFINNALCINNVLRTCEPVNLIVCHRLFDKMDMNI